MESVGIRFWSKVDKNGPVPENFPGLGQCWIWKASTVRGYGQFHYAGGVISAHRMACKLSGIRTAGLECHHKCNVSECVNPTHMEWIKPTEHRNFHTGVGVGKLSHREVEVLRLVCDGLSFREIAKALGISPRTSNTHLENIRKKTGFGRLALIVRFAVREGIVEA